MKAETYLVLAKDKKGWNKARVVRSTVRKPAKLARDEIAIKISVELPDDIFGKKIPEVSIQLPDRPEPLVRADADWSF